MCAFDPEDRRERCRSKEIECSCCPWMLTHMQSSERADAHAHLHKHNLDWVSQVQNICIHGRFCIGSTTYSVSSNCGTWLSTFTLRRPWTMLECFYGCIYGSVVLVYWIPPTESIFFFTQITLKNIFKYKKYLKVAFFVDHIDPGDRPALSMHTFSLCTWFVYVHTRISPVVVL